MKILLVGATGTLGRQIAKQAIEDGHEVRCFVRNPRKASFLQEWGCELTKGNSVISSDGSTLNQLLENIKTEYPDFVNRVLDEEGNLQRFVNIFLDDEDIRFLGKLETKLEDGQTVSIVPAVAGGKN